MARVSQKRQREAEIDHLNWRVEKLLAENQRMNERRKEPERGETMTIEDEAAYPVYWLELGWSCDGEHSDDYGGNHEGLPEGRIWNSTGTFKMFREVPTRYSLQLSIRDVWAALVKKAEEEGKHTNPIPSLLSYRFERWETWCGSWFSHWTLDAGQDDAAALRSFGNFVRRMERLNHEEGYLRKYTTDDGEEHSYWADAYCLMGAEDRWRWHGTEDGDTEKRTDPPCRCKHCKAQGVIRIGH